MGSALPSWRRLMTLHMTMFSNFLKFHWSALRVLRVRALDYFIEKNMLRIPRTTLKSHKPDPRQTSEATPESTPRSQTPEARPQKPKPEARDQTEVDGGVERGQHLGPKLVGIYAGSVQKKKKEARGGLYIKLTGDYMGVFLSDAQSLACPFLQFMKFHIFLSSPSSWRTFHNSMPSFSEPGRYYHGAVGGVPRSLNS